MRPEGGFQGLADLLAGHTSLGQEVENFLGGSNEARARILAGQPEELHSRCRLQFQTLGHGGTLITDPPVDSQASLTQPH
jgi:hypothetical protein